MGASASSEPLFFLLMIRRPPRSTLFPYHDALPISVKECLVVGDVRLPERGVGFLRSALEVDGRPGGRVCALTDRKSTRLNSSHANISYAAFCLTKKCRPTSASASPSRTTTTTTPPR